MDDQAMPVGAIVFFAGLPFLIFLQWKLGLLAGRHARHQNRNLYGLILGLFFVAVFLLWFRPDARVLAFSVVLALVLALPAWWWQYRNYERKISGHKLLVARRSEIKHFAVIFGVVFGVMLFGRAAIGLEFMDAHWLVLGLAMAWPLATAYAYFYVSRVEHRLGQPLEEYSPNE